jgi:hypothetical protein
MDLTRPTKEERSFGAAGVQKVACTPKCLHALALFSFKSGDRYFGAMAFLTGFLRNY